MRKSPSDAHTILDLLEKCQRNLRGIELRTAEQPAEFSKEDMKQLTQLMQSIETSLSGLPERFSSFQPFVKERKPKPSKQLTAVQEYMRKYK